MKIVVLVKTVPDSEARMEIEEGGRALKIERRWELNYFDSVAVEKAVQIKEKSQGIKVIVLTYGPPWAIEGLRKAIAMGADEAVHIEGPERVWTDPLDVARELARVLREIGFDLVLCGLRATDDGAGQVGGMVAGFLGIPYLGFVTSLEVEKQTEVLVGREVDGIWEKVRCGLPAVVCAQKGLAEPRVPTIQGTMKAMRMQPRKLAPLGLASETEHSQSWRFTGFLEPPRRPPVVIIKGQDGRSKAKELVRLLREKICVT